MHPQGRRSKSDSCISHHEFSEGTYRIFENINYCRGRVVYVDDTFVDVTFVFYESKESAKKIFNKYSKLNNGGVVRVWSIGGDEGSQFEGMGFFVVSFDEFEGFFSEDIFQRLENFFGTGTPSLPGIPPDWVVFLIKELINALKYLFSRGLTCCQFDLPLAYVWCKDDNIMGHKLKLFLINEDKHDYDEPEAWNWVLEDSISSFGHFLNHHVLVQDHHYKVQKDSFMDCFDRANNDIHVIMPPMKRLCMIETSPFLELNVQKILELVWLADQGIQKHCLTGFDMKNIEKAIPDQKIFEQVCPSGHWRNHISVDFKKYLDEQMEKFSAAKPDAPILTSEDIYDGNLVTLIQWVRNAFEHGSLWENDIYEEVMQNWPTLFSRVHQLFWHYKVIW